MLYPSTSFLLTSPPLQPGGSLRVRVKQLSLARPKITPGSGGDEALHAMQSIFACIKQEFPSQISLPQGADAYQRAEEWKYFWCSHPGLGVGASSVGASGGTCGLPGCLGLGALLPLRGRMKADLGATSLQSSLPCRAVAGRTLRWLLCQTLCCSMGWARGVRHPVLLPVQYSCAVSSLQPCSSWCRGVPFFQTKAVPAEGCCIYCSGGG